MGRLEPRASIALDTCLARGPVAAARRDAEAARRSSGRRCEQELTAAGVEVSPGSQAPYLLCRVPGRPDVRDALRAQGDRRPAG